MTTINNSPANKLSDKSHDIEDLDQLEQLFQINLIKKFIIGQKILKVKLQKFI